MNSPHHPIPDVQNFKDTRDLSIDRVGIKNIRHPIAVVDSAGHPQHTVARINMYVGLPAHVKGTHMSRFIELLGTQPLALSRVGFAHLLLDTANRLEARDAHIELSFPYFIAKTAPVSGVRSLLDYEITVSGEIVEGVATQTLRVLAPVTSLCPCSKTISERGAHNQRSHVTVTAEIRGDISIEELAALIEQEASCELYGLLKRPDEKYVTERAYDNPKFVEDLVRDVAARVNADSRIGRYTVESENFESIHNHSAYALIEGRKS